MFPHRFLGYAIFCISGVLSRLSWIGLIVAIGSAQAALAWGQDSGPPISDLNSMADIDLRFAGQLRAQGTPDLAVDYIVRVLPKYGPIQQAPLRVVLAGAKIELSKSIPDAEARRLMMTQAKSELDAFVRTNPQSPLVLQASISLGNVAIRLGEAQMAKALLLDPKSPNTVAEKTKGRDLLGAGILQVQALLKKLDDIEKSGSDLPGYTASRLREEKLLAKLNIAEAQFNLARLYNDPEKESTLRAQAIDVAFKSFDALANEDNSSPICWKAYAWAAFLLKEKGEPKKARDYIRVILSAKDNNPGARAGKAWAAYFRLRILREDPEPGERNQAPRLVLDGVKQWQADFRNFREPQGDDSLRLGLRMLQAQATYDQAKAINPKDATAQTQKNRLLAEARSNLRELEQGDHEFTDSARNLKIQIVRDQGVFPRKVEQLNTFEDCFIRAQVEAMEMDQDPSREKDANKLKALREQRSKLIIDSLIKGLDLDLKSAPAFKATAWERGNARIFLGYFLDRSGQTEKAADVSEALCRNEPRAFQAEKAGILALQSLGQAQQEREKNTGKEDKKNIELKNRIQSLADYLISRWPDSSAGNAARHQLGLIAVRDRKLLNAVNYLGQIPDSYEGINFVRYQLGLAAFDLAAETKDDKARLRGILALEAVTDQSQAEDPGLVLVYVLAKLRLASEYYSAKRYIDVVQLASKISSQIPSAKIDSDPARARELREKLQTNADTLRLYAIQAQSSVLLREGKLKEALELINPVIQQAKAGQIEVIRKDPNLATGFLNLALRASVQGRDMAKAGEVLAVMQQLDGGSGDDAVKNQLAQVYSLARQVAGEIKILNDPKMIETSRAGMAAVVEELAKNSAKYNTENTRLLALSFSALELHKRAVEVMQLSVDKVIGDSKSDPAKFKQDGSGQGLLLTFVKELRKDGRAAEARQYLVEWMGTAKAPGWASNSVEAKLERLNILASEEKHGLVVTEASALAKQLLPRATDNLYKERYLEAFWHMVQSTYLYGKGKKDGSQMDRAGSLLAQMERSWPEFGSPESRARVEEMLNREPNLRERFEASKKKSSNNNSNSPKN
jgi:hypothetical protein